MSAYRARVFEILTSVLRGHGSVERALDFGAGDGWFAERLEHAGLAREVVAVDVMHRARSLHEVMLYDGSRLPFDDRSFDLAYAVDTLHHCPDPRANLRELARCTRRALLLKDHVHQASAGMAALAVLDEIGNRRFGVPSPRNYQARWEWLPLVADAGFALRTLVHPAVCHRGPLGWATNRLQFVALWTRSDA